MDFTRPETLIVRLKAQDDERIFYCSRAAVKSFTMNEVSGDDVLLLRVGVDRLLRFLQIVHDSEGLWHAVETLTLEDKIELMRTLKECGVACGSELDGFHVMSDVIFESFGSIDWPHWKMIADLHGLDMYELGDAITLLSQHYGEAEQLARLDKKATENTAKYDESKFK